MRLLNKLIFFVFVMTLLGGCANQKKASSPSVQVEKEKSDFLAGLTKAEKLGQAALDGESIPIYTIDGERIKGAEIMGFMTSEKFKSEQYVDANKVVKAWVFRPATEEEIQQTLRKRAESRDKNVLKGKTALPFSVTDINGKNYELDSLKGKIVVLNFWFVACAPCRKEIPELNELVQKYQNEEVVFLALAKDDKESLAKFLEKKEFLYKIIPNSDSVIEKYKIRSFPTHIIIDEKSKITYVNDGYSATTVSSLEKEIERLLEK